MKVLNRYLVTFSVKTEGQELRYLFLTECSSKKEALGAASDAWYAKRDEEGYHKMFYKKAKVVKGEAAAVFSCYRNNKFYRFLSETN